MTFQVPEASVSDRASDLDSDLCPDLDGKECTVCRDRPDQTHGTPRRAPKRVYKAAIFVGVSRIHPGLDSESDSPNGHNNESEIRMEYGL